MDEIELRAELRRQLAWVDQLTADRDGLIRQRDELTAALLAERTMREKLAEALKWALKQAEMPDSHAQSQWARTFADAFRLANEVFPDPDLLPKLREAVQRIEGLPCCCFDEYNERLPEPCDRCAALAIVRGLIGGE